ncbi:MAG TPA: XTP/dITP diphosphatase [Thermodesulfovibrionales bacterium]|nr:XTP/dITP diphosphatase [Thermodesulfovibrionales bacterium]
MEKLVLVTATRNRKKVEEIRRILEGVAVELLSLDDFPCCPEVAEDADTFKGNAVKKARAVANFTGKPSVADDSGLEVDVLKGAPGVLSARYAGSGADDKKNLEKLLAELRGTEESGRGARFVCVIALAFPNGRVETFHGVSEGRIGAEPRGFNGFGYDPVFYPRGHHTTFAEMSADEKDALSHRGIALRKLRAYLSSVMWP